MQHSISKSLNLSIVIPVHNECENIQSLKDDIEQSFMAYHDWEVIWVNDGSTDHTQNLLESFHTSSDNHTWIQLKKQCGQGLALWDGLQKTKYENIGILDGDGQNPPHEFIRMMAIYLVENLDIIQGIRINREDSFFRIKLSTITNRLRQWITGDCITDLGCALKIFKSEHKTYLYQTDQLHCLLALLITRNKHIKIRQVPVSHRKRNHGRTHYAFLTRIWPTFIFCKHMIHMIRSK